jgi:hypothetical protein
MIVPLVVRTPPKKSLLSRFINILHYLGFEVPTAVKISMFIFWVVTPCGLVGGFRRYERLEEHSAFIFRPEDGDIM